MAFIFFYSFLDTALFVRVASQFSKFHIYQLFSHCFISVSSAGFFIAFIQILYHLLTIHPNSLFPFFFQHFILHPLLFYSQIFKMSLGMVLYIFSIFSCDYSNCNFFFSNSILCFDWFDYFPHRCSQGNTCKIRNHTKIHTLLGSSYYMFSFCQGHSLTF